tara:strand:+ start:8107 stop:8505 length:399 start_codon:yes stop_codon:yes gene_type:complete
MENEAGTPFFDFIAGGRRGPAGLAAAIEGEAYARRTDPETSHAAAAAMEGTPAAGLQTAILAALVRFGPMTALEIENAVRQTLPDVDSNTITPRLAPMRRAGLIERTGIKRPGRTTRGQFELRACAKPLGNL